MSNPIIRFPLDTTGLNSDNFVEGEIHSIGTRAVRVIAPTYGAYFTESLKVYDNRTQRLLVRGTQYLVNELLQAPTEMYGKELCYLIVIIDPTINSEILIQYQALGGLYTRSGDALVNLYNTLMNDERPVNWLDVLNRPLEFPPVSHLHDIRDVYGFQYLVVAIERLRNAIIGSDVPAYESIMDWLTKEINTVKAANQSDMLMLGDHAKRTDNPHVVTKAQIGLDKVENFTPATTVDIGAIFTYPFGSSEGVVPDEKYVTLRKLLTFRDGTIGLINNSLTNVQASIDEGINHVTTVSAPITHVGSVGVAHGTVTGSSNGFMSSADKNKLDAITGTNTGDQGPVFGRLKSDGVSYGTYGSVSIKGSGNGYAGVVFDDVSGALMDSGTLMGYYRTNNKWLWNCDNIGNFVASGNLSAYSDERLKANWKPVVNNFVVKWAKVKSGIYDRIDTGSKQVGLSAQSVQDIVPEAVNEDSEGLLSLNYGGVAAVATVEIAKQTVSNSNEISMLLDIIKGLEKRIELLEKK